MGHPLVEFLWWRECDSWERALEELRVVMNEAGLGSDRIEMIEVVDEDDAERHSFIGSPTIRIEGLDVDRPATGEPFGLTCRIYRRTDGRVSPLPDGAQVREAIRTAMTTYERLD